MRKLKPMPMLLRCPLCPEELPQEGFSGHYHWIVIGVHLFTIRTKYYLTRRGARNGWNRLMRKMGENQ